MDTQHSSQQERRFTQWFCILFVCFGAVIFVFKRTDLFPWMGECNPAGYSDEYYMAYCHSTRYGDYEHFALYNESEPRAIAALKDANVLFLGNSNTQYAFSTNAVQDYFDATGISHYVMGFGQGAQSPVAHAVIKKHALQPRMIVANVDPFFSTQTNGTFQRVLDEGDTLLTEFDRKRALQHWQAKVCANPESGWSRWVCQGRAETLYRSRENGHWLTDYYRENGQHPVSVSTDLLPDLDVAEEAANLFIGSLGLKRDCVVLTVTPRTGTPAEFANALAIRLQLPIIAPELDKLVTIDHSHLDEQSAQRWSAAFLNDFDQYAKRCVGPAVHASADNND